MKNRITHFIRSWMPAPKSDRHWAPIIVYQMGKVGSASVHRSLIATFKSMGVSIPIHHIHNLNNLEAMESAIMRSQVRHNPEVTLMGIRLGLALRKQMNENPDQDWNLITLVRDPIARNVSDFFHGLQEIIPDFESRYNAGRLPITEVQEAFLTKFDHHITPKVWFDTQMKTVFQIDVYAQPFPKQKGFEIYEERKHARLLLIRLEDLDRVANQAMKSFLHIKHFDLIKSNVGAEKGYARLYHEFKKLPLPKMYLDDMYSSKYARHFYTNHEMEEFRARWSPM